MIKYIKSTRFFIVVFFLVGLVLTMGAWVWGEKQTDQTGYYNRGLIAYTMGAYDLAVQDFDLSFADYSARLSAGNSAVSAPASLEQAVLAQEHKALALVKMKQITPAVLSYKECLRLTSDFYMSRNTSHSDSSGPGEARAAYAKIEEDGTDCAINLEILFHQQQQQADQEGKGKGNGKPRDGDQSSEDPANGAGKDKRNQVND
jgi:hypothetical protein